VKRRNDIEILENKIENNHNKFKNNKNNNKIPPKPDSFRK